MLTFGVISYGLAAAGFLAVTLLLLISWEGRGQGARLIVACAINAAWAGALAGMAWMDQMPVALLAITLFLRDAAWLVVLTGLLSRGEWPGLLTRGTHLLIGAFLLVGVVILGADLVGAALPFAPSAFLLGGLILPLVGLVLLEQLFRNANPAGRYALKYLVVGLGVLFAYDLFLFSQAQLLKGIDAGAWQARGLVNALVVPLVALAARGNPQWAINVFVSRQVVFYTTTFLAVGAYLLVMAAGGYAIRLYGGTWGRIAQLVFFAGAGIVLALLLASAQLRRKLRVFLAKHFYRNKYDYRVEWLRFIETLGSADGRADTYQSAVRSIAQIVGSPAGVLYLPIDGGQGFGAAAGWPEPRPSAARFPVVSDDDELLAFVRRRQWVIDLHEYHSSPDAYQNVVLPDFLRGQERWRLLVPLMLHDDCLGLVLLADPPPPFDMTYEDLDLLKTVGRHVATHIAQHEADRRLAESRQFEAYHRLTAFVMHDLKNLAAQLSLLVANAEQHKHNPEFVDDAISTIANSTARMQRLVDQLQGREVKSVMRRTSLAELAGEACRRCAVRAPVPVCGPVSEDACVEADPERLGMMVEHLIRNAQEATAADGEVRVSVGVTRDVRLDSSGASGIHAVTPAQLQAAASLLEAGGNAAGVTSAAGDYACLSVEDTGAGMTPEFVKERLFRPFDTTKGSKGMGIGAYQVREYVRSIGGRVRVESSPGQGTRFTLWLPLRAAGEAVPQA